MFSEKLFWLLLAILVLAVSVYVLWFQRDPAFSAAASFIAFCFIQLRGQAAS